MLSWIKSFCGNTKEGEYYRRRFLFFKEKKESSLPVIHSDFPFREFKIESVLYRSNLFGYCVQDAFTFLGLWNGFGGGNISEVHIEYFEANKYKKNPLITVFEDEEYYYFRVANVDAITLHGPNAFVLFYKGTACVVKIDISNLKEYYQIDYKDKVSHFRVNRVYTNSFVNERKEIFERGIKIWPRTLEIVPNAAYYCCFTSSGDLMQPYRNEYIMKFGKPNNDDYYYMLRDSTVIEDPLEQNEAFCKNCNKIYIKSFFDVGVCDVRCNWLQMKMRPGTDFYEWEAAIIEEKYPYLKERGIPLRRFYFTNRLNIASSVKHLYYTPEFNFVEYKEEPSKALVIFDPRKRQQLLAEIEQKEMLGEKVKIWTNFRLKDRCESLYQLLQYIEIQKDEQKEKEEREKEEKKKYDLYLFNHQVVLHSVSVLGTPFVRNVQFNFIRDKLISNLLIIDLLLEKSKNIRSVSLNSISSFMFLGFDAAISLLNDNLTVEELSKVFLNYIKKDGFMYFNGVKLNVLKLKGIKNVFKNKPLKRSDFKVFVKDKNKLYVTHTEDISDITFKKMLIIKIYEETFGVTQADVNLKHFCAQYFPLERLKLGNFKFDLVLPSLNEYLNESLEQLNFEQSVLNSGFDKDLNICQGFNPLDYEDKTFFRF